MTSTKAKAYKRYRAYQRRKNKEKDLFVVESTWNGARFIVAITILSMLIMAGHATEGSGRCKWSGCRDEKISSESMYCSEHYHQHLSY